MLKTILVALMSALLANNSGDNSTTRFTPKSQDGQTGIQQKLIVESGSLSMNVDLNRLNGTGSRPQQQTLRFGLAPNSFFTVLVFNDELRGIEPGSMAIISQNAANLPAALNASVNQLVMESLTWGNTYELVIRDGKTGFTFFNIEGQLLDFDGKQKVLTIKEGRLLLSKEFAAKLGRPGKAGTVIGEISVTATMRPIEVLQVVNGEVKSSEMPSIAPLEPNLVPGPDVIVGALSGLAQFGSSSGTQVGLAVATDSCNAGIEPLHWFALPINDHPVIPQNLYRMAGGTSNDDRFEQIGQSNVKHAFTALQENICNFGCASSGTGTLLGAGCSDPYSASLNSGSSGNSLGSRAWINPFTGAYPRGDSSTPPNTHTGHSHTGPSHRILVEMADLNTTLNPGATYYAEAQYVTPHEYAWCQAHAGQCNMNNNASFRQFTVSGTTSFSFAAVGSTIQTKPAITNWAGATVNSFVPDPGNDGLGYVGTKVTNPSPGVWHYEYAVYNQNLDRAIQSFSVPIAGGTTISNTGFHAPPQHPGWTNDGTVGNAGYSSTPWSPTQTSNSISWASETLAQNPNANAIRWGTLYNFRFDANRPPATVSATVGFYKTGAPITVQIQAPSLPSLSINDVSVTEGNGGTTTANFTITLSSASTDTVSVQWATANATATGGSDFVTNSGTATFTPGQVTQPVSITVNGDTIEEFNETFLVNLTNPVNATLNDGQGVGTITNDDVLATLPAGFNETQVSGLSNPTAFAIHPDGRIFVCEQAGTLRVVKNGVLLPTPFTSISVNFPAGTERGLLGVAFDPNYAANHFIYVYYTAPTPTIHNRVSRFTANIANEDVAVAGSELAILDLETLGATNHNGGAIHFGPDGKLYVAVGENATSSNAQRIDNRLGKMLRINSDGTIPGDNPTTFPNIAGSTTGPNQAIWAVGLRNPFTFNFQPGTGRLHINDVGQNTWEEINNGLAGSNYGWPTCEGSCGTANMTNPIYQFANDASTCAIAGGDFYNPTTPTFPAQYLGQYFFADLCGGWIKTIDPLSPPATGTAASFATGINQPVDIHVANDGSLYYLARGTGLFQIQYFGVPQLAINDVSVTEGNSGTATANFTVTLSPASSQTVQVNYATGNNTATAGSDYTTASGTVTFAPGQTTRPVSVFVSGDTTFEPDETFNVNLTSPVNATVGDAQGVGTITNDDSQPTISINDVTVNEGNAGTTTATFTVSLSNLSSQTVTVNYATADNSATQPGDYSTASGTVTINPNTPSQTFTVNVNGDTLTELNESFFVNLSSPSNATINDGQGVGTITNDDAEPSVSINDATVTEGNSGTTTATFTVSLSNPSSQTVTVNFATADNTATTANGDYVATSGTLTFNPTQLTQQVNVTVNGDAAIESNESFFVNLSLPSNSILGDGQGVGTITNDDSGQPGISINDVSVTEGNAGTTTATFTVSLSASSSQTVTVNYTTADNSATAGSDYSTTSGQLSFTPGQTSQPINVTVSGDTTFESNETFFINLSTAVNATISDNQGTGTINNDDSQPGISINDVSVTEGNAGTTTATFTVSLSNPSSQTVSVNFATAGNNATSGTDFQAASGPISFTPSQLTQQVNVTVNGDLLNEVNETFFVNLSGASNGTIADNQGQGTINDDDAQPSISINDVSVTEGNAGTTTATFTVSLSAASGQAVSVNYATAGNTATSGTDFVAASGPVNFTAGQTSQQVSITVNGDVLNETNETFFVNLSGASNASISDNQGQGTITDDDAQPSISINDVSVTEGNAGTATATFTVSLSAASGQAVSVNYATAGNTATSGTDFVAASGPVNFTAGQTSQQVSITVNGDVLNEANETFFVNLSGASNATISDNQGQGTITDDDAQPSLSINDVTLVEGNAGTSTANFTVSLSAASGQTVGVNFGTADGTAAAGSDYVTNNGSLSFTPGQTTQPVSITINGDHTNEANETFFVNLSGATNATISDNQGLGTINDDDSQPTLSINDVTVTEGNAGTVNASFTVSLSPASGQTVMVQYATANGTASAADYSGASGTLTFTPGQTSQPVTVTVNGDLLNETNETFFVNLSNASNAIIGDNQGLGTITDDDAQPSLSINDLSVSEGNAGTGNATFTVTLSAASGQTVMVNYSSADGTASSTSDYVAASGTLTFAPGDLTKSVSITVNGDTAFESNETFLVNLSNASNATISDNQGQGTILNDDLQLPTLQFSAANFNQPESSQSLLVTVTRSGDPTPAVSVDFTTVDSFAIVDCTLASGQANQRCDYLSTSGTLSFASGEVQKTFRVITYNDVYVEGNETINLSLSNPSAGAQLGSQNTATITIQDNDSTAPTTNPIDDAQFFVRQHYADFLQRVPDTNGEAFWVQQITACGSDPVCIHNKRLSTSDAFFFEPEYQQTAAFVVRLYRIAFGNDQPFRNPDSSDLVEARKIINYSVFVKDRARVVGGSNLAQSQLNLANAFVLRPEFLTKYPAGLSGPDFVDAVLSTIRNDLGVEMNSQRPALINLFNSGGRGTVMYRLADDNAGSNPIDNRALIDAEYNRTFVFTEYAGYLRRNADIGGFKFWLGQVNGHPLRDVNTQHAMVCAFITSLEYQQRFSSIVTRNNTNCQ